MNHNRSTALERSVKKLLGGLNRFYGYPISPSASIMAQNIQLFLKAYKKMESIGLCYLLSVFNNICIKRVGTQKVLDYYA